MENEKIKVDEFQSKHPNPIWGCLFRVMLLLVFGFAFLWFGLDLLTGRMIWSAIDPSLISIAESHLNIPREVTINGNMRISLILGDNDIGYPVCVELSGLSTEEFDAFRQNSSLYIDGQAVREGVYTLLVYPAWCTYGIMESGLHLVELRLKDADSSKPIQTLIWGIMFP